MPRTFIAFPILEEYWSNIVSVQTRLKKMGIRSRLIKADHFHVTAAFLGDISKEQIMKVQEGLKGTFASYKPLMLTCNSITGFPAPERTRAIAIKLSGKNSTKLQRQVSQIRKKLQKLEIAFEPMPFVPHISIGRIDRGSDFSQTFPLATEKNEVLLSDIDIYISELHDDGSMSYIKATTYLTQKNKQAQISY